MCIYKTLLLTVKVYFAGMDKRKQRIAQNCLALHLLGKEPEPVLIHIQTSQEDVVHWLWFSQGNSF